MMDTQEPGPGRRQPSPARPATEAARRASDLQPASVHVLLPPAGPVADGPLAAALEAAREAREAARAGGDRATAGAAAAQSAMLLVQADRMGEAFDLLAEACAELRGLGDSAALARALCDFACLNVVNVAGDVALAVDLFEESLAVARRCGSALEEGRTLSFVGGVFAQLGWLEEAEALLGRGIEAMAADAARAGNNLVLAANNYGCVLSLRGRHREARAQFERALLLPLADDDSAPTVNLRCSLAVACARLGDHAAAQQALASAERRVGRAGAAARVDYLQAAGRVHLLDRDPQAAEVALVRALELAQTHGLDKHAAQLRCDLSEARRRCGDPVRQAEPLADAPPPLATAFGRGALDALSEFAVRLAGRGGAGGAA